MDLPYEEIQSLVHSIPNQVDGFLISCAAIGTYRTIDRLILAPKKEVKYIDRMTDEIVDELCRQYNNKKRTIKPEIFKIALEIKAKTNRKKFDISPYLRIGEILTLVRSKISAIKGFPNQEKIIEIIEKLILEWTDHEPDPPKGFFKRLKKQKRLTTKQKKFIDPNGRGNWLYRIAIENDISLDVIFIKNNINYDRGLKTLKNNQKIKCFEKDVDLNDFISPQEKANFTLIFITDEDGKHQNVPADNKIDNEQIGLYHFEKPSDKVPARYGTVTEQVLTKDAYHISVLIHTQYKTVIEQVIAKDSSKKFQEVPAQYELQTVPAKNETVTEQVIAKDTSKKFQEVLLQYEFQTAPTQNETVNEQVFVKDLQCKFTTPIIAQYESVSEEVMAKDAFWELQELFANYGKVSEQVKSKKERDESSRFMMDGSAIGLISEKGDSKETNETQSICNHNLNYLRDSRRLCFNKMARIKTLGAGGHSSYFFNRHPKNVINNENSFAGNHVRSRILRNTQLLFYAGLSLNLIIDYFLIGKITIANDLGKNRLSLIALTIILCFSIYLLSYYIFQTIIHKFYLDSKYHYKNNKWEIEKRRINLMVKGDLWFRRVNKTPLVRVIVSSDGNDPKFTRFKRNFKPILFKPNIFVQKPRLVLSVNDSGYDEKLVKKTVNIKLIGSTLLEKGKYCFSQN